MNTAVFAPKEIPIIPLNINNVNKESVSQLMGSLNDENRGL